MSSMKEWRSKSSPMVAFFVVRAPDNIYILFNFTYFLEFRLSSFEFSLIGQFMYVARSVHEKEMTKASNVFKFIFLIKFQKNISITIIKKCDNNN